MKIHGIITAMVTPFDENQKMNKKATEALVDRLIERGVHGLFILGTNGEFHTLSDEEKVEFAKWVVAHTNKRVPVYAGTGGCSTKGTIELSLKMKEAGVDALSVITPYLLPLSQEEIFNHYKAIAEAVEIPIILYNIPKNTGNNINPETLKRLMDVKNIWGIKDSSGNTENTQGYVDVSKEKDFAVLMGSDSKILAGLKMGVKGSVASTSNVITEHIVSIYNSFMENDMEKAQKLQEEVDVLRDVSKLGTIPSVIKRALVILGVEAGEARLPVSPIGAKHDEEISKMLKFYGLL